MGDWVHKGDKAIWAPTNALQQIMDRCEELGFRVRRSGQYHNSFSATHDDRGVKLTVHQTYRPPYSNGPKIGQFTIEVKAAVKSTHDTWVVPSRMWKERHLSWELPHEGAKVQKPQQHFHSSWLVPDAKMLADVLADIDKFRGASKEKRANRNKIAELYDPLSLDAESIQEATVDTSTHGKRKGVALKHMLHSAVVIGFAVINEDLYINDVDACAPDSDPWFHLAATTDTASPHLMVRQRPDGVYEYYPARRAGKRFRISQNTTPSGTYIDFTKVTKLDAVLIEAAIQEFVKGL